MRASPFLTTIVLLLAAAILAGCASSPRYRAMHREVVSEPLPPLPSSQVIFYPAAGQSAQQQDRDRFECYEWSVKQTGYDPGRAAPASRQRVEVTPVEPPGHDTAVGAVTGAILGAAVSRPRNAAGGALIGAVAGAMVGGASDVAREEHAQRIQRRYDARDEQRIARDDAQINNYRRAMAACLEGRNYTVQ